jgi:hypothetical protein
MVARALVIDGRATDAAAAAPVAAAPEPTANPYLPPPAGAVASAPPLPVPPPTSFAPGGASATTAPTLPSPGTAPTVPDAVAARAAASAPPAPPAPSPVYAPPSAASPAAPVGTGLISQVPGARPSAAAPPAPAPAAPAPAAAAASPAAAPAPVNAPAPVAAPAPAAESEPEGDLDRTRAVAPATPPAALLVWDNGTRVAVYGRTLFGRNPAREDGATAVAVRDETLSLSKTHFEVDGAPGGAWVIDRHSTNGVVLVRDGGRTTLVPGERTALRAGDRLEFGDRSATIEVAA